MLAKRCLLVGIFTLLSVSLAIADPPAVHPVTGEELVIDCLRGTPDAIDGDLSDWNLEAMTPAVLDVVEQLHSGQDSWDGPVDCGGDFYLLWDDENIYIAVVVKDDKLSMNKSGGDIWNADAIEVLFSTLNAVPPHDEHYQYGFNANDQKFNWCNMDGAGNSEPDYLQIASSVTADGYICEASISYGQMPSLDFSVGNTIGFHPVFDDTDNGDRELQMTWTGREAHDQSLGFGHMILSEAEPAPPELSVMIPVLNAGFEDPVLDEDGYTWGDVPGWTLVGGEATGVEGSGVWSVTLADFDPVIAPEGENVLFTEYLPEGIAKGVTQVLTETFAADTDYTLTAEVGNSNYYYNGGYSVQLLAGGTVIAEDNDTLWPEYKTWATSTVAYTYDPNDSALVGQPLEIRLLNLELDKDSPPAGEVVGVEFDNVTLSYVAGAEPGVTIPVDPNSDIAAANELAQPGDTIEFAAGVYNLTSQIEIKDGVTYQGAGPGLTIIDGNDVTRAFVAWGDRGATNGQIDANGLSVPNATGPTGWVLEGLTIQNCVADTKNREDILSSARDLLTNYTGAAYTLATAQEENGGVTNNPEWFDILSNGTDDDLTDAELQAYLDGNPVGSDGHLVVNGDKTDDGGAITIHDGAVGTIANCEFLNNYTPAGGGDDGGAINITGLSVITINDCLFDGNYAVSPDSVAVDGSDGDAGHIKVQGNTPTDGFINAGTTLIANRCTFLNGNAEDDAGAIQANSQGVVARIDSCWFEANTAWDNGTVLQFPNEDQHEATVTNCVFVNNITKADNSPDRMCEVRRNTKFINCTFMGNVQEDQDLIYNNANAADGDNDGTDEELADATQVINCIFVNNVVGNGDDVLGSRNADFTIAATNCLFFGNTLQNGDPADNTQRPADEVGSILDDPLLDALLYIPGLGSPAIDAGIDPATLGVTVTTDLNGDPRPQGAGYDIGAFETPAN